MTVQSARAVATALWLSVRYARVLGIRPAELVRYLKKSTYCALCYLGLGVSRSAREARLAGEAAFLSTAFDVLTDWRREPSGAAIFSRILDARVANGETRRMAMTLYGAKQSQRFAHDGLERGAGALRLILRVMECEAERSNEWGDLDRVGHTLQFVDDVLDLEHDIERGELNCLTSPRRRDYIAEFLDRHRRGVLHAWFGPRRSVLLRVVEVAAAKAERFSATDGT